MWPFYKGLANAVHGRVQIVVSRAAPAHLSNGHILHTRVWSPSLMPGFLLLICGLAGQTYMGKQIGNCSLWPNTMSSCGFQLPDPLTENSTGRKFVFSILRNHMSITCT